jgi:Protein of unknown function (DUF1822)
MSDLIDINDYDFYSLDEESLSLTDEQITRASRISDLVADIGLKWQVYLNVLGLAGFENWLDDQSDDLKVDCSECSLLSNPAIPAADNLLIRGFKVCTIAVSSIDEDYISIPQSILSDSSKAAHFYVFVQVLEEIAQTSILGFIRYDQLKARIEMEPLEHFPDGTNDLPNEWLIKGSDELLLYLRCLDPVAIPLPVAFSEQLKKIGSLGLQEIDSLLSSIQEFLVANSENVYSSWARLSNGLDSQLNPAFRRGYSNRQGTILDFEISTDEINNLKSDVVWNNSLIDGSFIALILELERIDKENGKVELFVQIRSIINGYPLPGKVILEIYSPSKQLGDPVSNTLESIGVQKKFIINKGTHLEVKVTLNSTYKILEIDA